MLSTPVQTTQALKVSNSMEMYIVLSYSTKSKTLASTNVDSQKSLKNETEHRKARQILVMRESTFFGTLVTIMYIP